MAKQKNFQLNQSEAEQLRKELKKNLSKEMDSKTAKKIKKLKDSLK